MTIPSRLEVYHALMDHLRTVPGVVSVSDRPQHHSKVDRRDMPMILLLPQAESHAARAGGETVPVLAPVLVLYVSADDGVGVSATQALNGALDTLDTAFVGSPLTDRRQTLNGLVYQVRIAGTVETDGGEWVSKAGAVIPLEIHLQP